jgi:hypothetical protein
MKTPFAIGGSIGLGIVLIVALASGLMWLSRPAMGVPAGKPAAFPSPAGQPAPEGPAFGPPPSGVDQATQIDLIRRIMAKPDLQLTFDSIQQQVNAGMRNAAMYVDDAGSKYYIDLQSGRLAEIDAGFASHPEVPADQAKSMDELRSIATQFAQANSVRLVELNKSLVYDEGCKGNICFYRWDARNLPIEWTGTDWAMMAPFLQVGVLTDGRVVTYYNTFDLFETTVPMEPLQPTPENVIDGGTVLDGPFTFDLRLIRDPSLTRQPVAPSLFSDMEGFGTYMYWSYTGSEVMGPVTTYWGTEPQVDQLLQATYAQVQMGSSGGRTGGILLPGGSVMPGQSKAGDRERVVLKVSTPGGDHGAVLLFTLKQGANGFEPVDVSVEVLQGK